MQLNCDFPHTYVPSSREGHGHLYIDVEMSTWRWAVLMTVLRWAGVVEKGYWIWSLRRGGNFVRPVGSTKEPDEVTASTVRRTYGWIFPKRQN